MNDTLIPNFKEDNVSIQEKAVQFKIGDSRSLRDLPEGAEGSTRCFIRIQGRRVGMVKIGTIHPKTGAITIFTYESRLATSEAEKQGSFYGLIFYWRSLEINGEEILRLERALGIGDNS